MQYTMVKRKQTTHIQCSLFEILNEIRDKVGQFVRIIFKTIFHVGNSFVRKPEIANYINSEVSGTLQFVSSSAYDKDDVQG